MAKTHRQIEDESMRLVGDGSNLSKGGEDYDAKYKKLLKQYGLERKETDFEKDMKKYGPSIKEGMKKSRESNAARAATNAALKIKDAGAAPSGAEANTHRAREERSMQPQTKVKASKGGYVEAETRGVAAATREKPKVKRRSTTLAPQGAASTKEKPSTEATITPKPRQSGRTGGANASTKGTPPSAAGAAPSGAEQEYYKTAGANKEEVRTKTPSKKRVNFYTGGPEWRQAIKRTLTAPLRLVARAAEEQEKKKKGSRFGSPYQLRTK